MPRQKHTDAWIAGFKEYRIALGVAGIASLMVAALLVLAPDTPPKGNIKTGIHKSDKQHQRHASPLYAIPQRNSAKKDTKKTFTQDVTTHRSNPVTKPAIPLSKATSTLVTDQQSKLPTMPMTNKIKPSVKRVPDTHKTNAQRPDAHQAIFFVQIGAYRERNSAQKQAASLMQKGWNSMLTRNAKGLHVVRVGPVTNWVAAKALLRQLKNKAHLSGFIIQGGK